MAHKRFISNIGSLSKQGVHAFKVRAYLLELMSNVIPAESAPKVTPE